MTLSVAVFAADACLYGAVSKGHKRQQSVSYYTAVSERGKRFCHRHPDDASFLSEPNTYKAIRFYESGTYTITVTGTKAGTTDVYTYSEEFFITETASNGGWF